jgi:Tol biopolymer transport system component
VLVLVAPANAAFPGQNGKIAFVSHRDHTTGGDINQEIYSIAADGTAESRITNNPATDGNPSWSADGSKIVFASNRDNNMEIYSMNADGSGATRLTSNSAQDIFPTWAPDGTRIAFTSNRSGSSRIYTMNADGSGVTELTNVGGYDWKPTWSPDGTRIAFQSIAFSDFEIYTVGADGTGLTQVTNNTSIDDTDPDWSPDGTELAFASARDDPNPTTCEPFCVFEVYTMNADGTGVTRLTHSPASGANPTWSPDGTRIAFYTARDGRLEIYTMNPDGSGQTRVTNVAGDNFDPTWQPVIPGYPRPKGASPLRASLVPAYAECTNPNSSHGAPLVYGSCDPPARTSQLLTVGTPDANGAGANSAGSVSLSTIVGDPSTAADEADLRFTVSLTDVRTSAVLGDYTGELLSSQAVRLTDRLSGSPPHPGTVQDFRFELAVPCAGTADTTVGSTCAADTTADAVVPGAVVEGKRAIWQLDQIQVFDGGPDGMASTAPNALFAVQGVFVP